MNQPVTCRPSDAKAVFGISRPTLYRWINKGHIEKYKRGGMSFVVVQEVLDFIKTGNS